MVDFGRDLSCTTDIASDGRTVTGFRLVGEAIYRRWTTPRGRLIGFPNYGFDITQYANADMSPRDIAALCAGMQNEAMKDERVESCSVSATLDSVGVLTITSVLTTGAGPFTLVVSATSVSVTLLDIQEAA